MSTLSQLYKRIHKIGEGTYGVVYIAENKQTGDYVALKQIGMHPDAGVPSTAVREISLLKELAHPNIVQLQDIVHGHNCLHLVFEHIEQDLKQFIDTRVRSVPLRSCESLEHLCYRATITVIAIARCSPTCSLV